MENTIAKQLAFLNQMMKEMDKIYHIYARQHGLSDTHLWLMYSLYEGEAGTQREICSAWHYPPQTINSALKSLERRGLIQLAEIPGNRKNKRVALTEQGMEFSREVILPLILAEQKAFQRLAEEERGALVALTSKYVDLLQTEIL